MNIIANIIKDLEEFGFEVSSWDFLPMQGEAAGVELMPIPETIIEKKTIITPESAGKGKFLEHITVQETILNRREIAEARRYNKIASLLRMDDIDFLLPLTDGDGEEFRGRWPRNGY